MKKLLIGSIIGLAIIVEPSIVSATDSVSKATCEQGGGSVATDAVGKNYCSGGLFNGLDIG